MTARFWTADRTDALCAMLAKGKTRDVIAAHLGTNVNAIGGAIDRLRKAGDPRVPPMQERKPKAGSAITVPAGIARVDRDPCFKCGVRGDVGCAHRVAPWGLAA